MFPFHDVYHLHKGIYNDSLPFEAFNSLQFLITNVNLTEYNRKPLDDIDTQIHNNIDVAISNCKYYTYVECLAESYAVRVDKHCSISCVARII